MSREPRHPEPGPLAVTVPYRIRFDECGPDGLARTSILLRLAQDAAWIHSEQLGFDRAWYARRGLAWLVRAAEIEVAGPIGVGATLSVTTRVVAFRRVTARRRTTVADAAGETLATVVTDWAMTDGRGRPTRIPAEFERFVDGPGEPHAAVRVPAPAAGPAAVESALAVRPQDVDPMGHLNNAAYVDYVEEALLGAVRTAALARSVPRSVRVEYLLPVAAGDVLAITAIAGRDGLVVGLARRDGVPVARALVTASGSAGSGAAT